MVSEVVSASITRPTDTTQYGVGEVIDAATGAGITFVDVVRTPGAKGVITGAAIIDSANQSTKPSIELWLFNAPLTAYDNDNAVFTPTDADLANRVGVITFPNTFVGDATSGASGNAVYQSDQIVLPFETVTRALYGVLVVRNAYTPVSAEIFTVQLQILQD